MIKYTIPNPPVNFSGRKREISRLCEYFENQRIIVIAGITGIGKTAILLEYIFQLRNLHQDKDFFYIECKQDWNFDNFLEELNKWFIDYGNSDFENVLRERNSDREGIIKSAVNFIEQGNVVLAIDNFHIIEDENTKKFIETSINYISKARILICTRKRLSLSPIHRIDILERRLDGLSLEDSISFMSKLIENHGRSIPDESMISKIYNTVQGHPFTLKLLSSLYITGELSFENMLYESREFGDEIEKYLLDSFFRSLSVKEKNFLKEFSVFNVPVSQSTIEHLITDYNFEDIRSKLVDLYIIDINSEKKYHLHSILRDYLRNKLTCKEKVEYYNRFAEYFADFDEVDMKLQAFYYWFEISDNRKAVDFLKTFIDRMFSQGKNFELFNIIHSVFDKFGDSFPVLRYFKANIYLRWGKLDECVQTLENLIHIVKDNNLKAMIYKTFGEAFSLLSENSKALDYFDEAINIFENIDDIKGITSCLIGKADSYRFSGQFSKALEYFEKAKENIDRLDLEMQARIYKGLGDIDFANRFFKRALSYYDKAIEIFSSINENFYVGKIMHNQAFLYFETGNTEKALEMLLKLLEYRKKINDTVGLVYNYSFIGEIYLLDWNIEKAEEYFDQAMRFAVDNQEKRGMMDLYLNLIRLYLIKTEYFLAEKILKDAYALTENFEGIESFEHMLGVMKAIVQYFKGEQPDLDILKQNIIELNRRYEYHWVLQGLFLLRKYSSESLKENEFKDLFENSLEKINKIEKAFFIKWFGEDETDERKSVSAVINGKEESISADIYQRYINDIEKFDLFVDLTRNSIIEKEKGVLNVLKKRTVANLFIYFINNPGKELSFKDIFESIWKREYDPETDAITVRVNISRLRSVLEPDPKNPKYIINAKESGFYLFNPKNNFAVFKRI